MRLKSQHGFTLVEMLVALLIAGIFFTVFVGVVLATFDTLRTGDERTVAQQNARVALNYIANDVRHASEIAPLRIEEYKDWATGGFPATDSTYNSFLDEDAWPIYRESVDSSPTGYIDLSMDGAPGEGDEYVNFRDDGLPYDVRALAPNRINLLLFGSSYYPNTQYYTGTGPSVDIDGTATPNPTAAVTRITYEHQLAPPIHPDIYDNSFSGLEKQFNMVVNSSAGSSIQDKSGFVVVRSFEARNPRFSLTDVGDTSIPANGPLGAVSDQIRENQPLFRQPVADHVLNLRFRYWYISGNNMLEIRYDPDIANIGSGSTGTNDGFYRYFDIWGNEIYVWYNKDAAQMVPLLPTDYDQTDLDSVPVNSFYIDGGDTADDEFQRGLLLFEGWKYVNAVSISVRTANNKTLDKYKSSINLDITSPGYPDYDPTNPDFGMGFIDFGLAGQQPDMTNTLNAFEPLYQAADNMRVSTAPVNGVDMFDFVEPNMNPNYEPNSFVTLQTIVSPPDLKDKARAAIGLLRFGLGHKALLGG